MKKTRVLRTNQLGLQPTIVMHLGCANFQNSCMCEMKGIVYGPILSLLTGLILSSYAQIYGLKYRSSSILIHGCCLLNSSPQVLFSLPQGVLRLLLSLSVPHYSQHLICLVKAHAMLVGATSCKVVHFVYTLHRCGR